MIPMFRLSRFSAVVLVVLAITAGGASARQAPEGGVDPLHKPLDTILDLYVRDGFVYYRALRSERARLDRYLASLNVPADTYNKWPREQRMAFWVNAYNAFVLKTVIDAYPIKGSSGSYPSVSIRQIPGAFETIRHRAAGRAVTLDEIEKKILPEFKEPRLYLALGRGAVGSGRLRSEAYSGSRLTEQLDSMQREAVTHQTMVKIDRAAGQITLTPIVSWHEAEFVEAYDKGATGVLAQRSPIERAIIGFLYRELLPMERDFVQKNEFRVTYHPFDWRLNDLTGGRVQ
jgi:hypothetical protein